MKTLKLDQTEINHLIGCLNTISMMNLKTIEDFDKPQLKPYEDMALKKARIELRLSAQLLTKLRKIEDKES